MRLFECVCVFLYRLLLISLGGTRLNWLVKVDYRSNHFTLTLINSKEIIKCAKLFSPLHLKNKIARFLNTIFLDTRMKAAKIHFTGVFLFNCYCGVQSTTNICDKERSLALPGLIVRWTTLWRTFYYLRPSVRVLEEIQRLQGLYYRDNRPHLPENEHRDTYSCWGMYKERHKLNLNNEMYNI